MCGNVCTVPRMSKTCRKRERIDMRVKPEELKMLQILQRYLTPKIGSQTVSSIYRTCIMKYGPVWIEQEYGLPFNEVVKFKT
jgi:hypothetical protein